jgi:hypothetical protein
MSRMFRIAPFIAGNLDVTKAQPASGRT